MAGGMLQSLVFLASRCCGGVVVQLMPQSHVLSVPDHSWLTWRKGDKYFMLGQVCMQAVGLEVV
jgi:hypothetical protein